MYYNNKKLALSVFWIIFGIVVLVLSIREVLDDVYGGMGGALIAIGVLQLWKNLKYRNDPEYRETIETAANDERNKLLRMKSWSITGYILVLVEAVGSVVAMVQGNQSHQQILALLVCLTLLVYYVSYIVLNKKY